MKIELPPTHRDPRGSIQNLLELDALDLPVRGVAIITSRARTTRSNHYHRTDGHWLYVRSGVMHYWERDLETSEYDRSPVIYKAGSMVFTGPLLWHRTYFPEETELFCMSLRPRDTMSHEQDVVRDGTK
jgi:dTDP-4-dehydrorhamnose 3,5-epimerase-like enzyme